MQHSPLRYPLVLALAATLGLAGAQTLGAEEILERLRASAEETTDMRFLLSGELMDRDGSVIVLEVAVEAIPNLPLARAEFIQPDALADNFVILDGDVVYNYLFLTNQVSILDAQDPDALGGLIGADETELGIDLTADLTELFEGWDVEVLNFEESPLGGLYSLRFWNRDLTAEVLYADAQVIDGAWVPYRVVLYEEGDVIFADLTFHDFEKNPGLDHAALRFIPADAEVFDER
jgi:outer membrane lipoprotein-sorting protein